MAKELGITTEQLILEKGHVMAADAVHSSLENYFKPPIYEHDYIREARRHKPYNIHVLDYAFFYKNDNCNAFSIKPGHDYEIRLRE